MVLSAKNICPLNNINYVFFVMMCGVLYEVRTELLNIIWTSFVFQKVNSYESLTIFPVNISFEGFISQVQWGRS
jgi:hypothetical protein